jgi:hypothetical protein
MTAGESEEATTRVYPGPKCAHHLPCCQNFAFSIRTFQTTENMSISADNAPCGGCFASEHSQPLAFAVRLAWKPCGIPADRPEAQTAVAIRAFGSLGRRPDRCSIVAQIIARSLTFGQFLGAVAILHCCTVMRAQSLKPCGVWSVLH